MTWVVGGKSGRFIGELCVSSQGQEEHLMPCPLLINSIVRLSRRYDDVANVISTNAKGCISITYVERVDLGIDCAAAALRRWLVTRSECDPLDRC